MRTRSTNSDGLALSSLRNRRLRERSEPPACPCASPPVVLRRSFRPIWKGAGHEYLVRPAQVKTVLARPVEYGKQRGDVQQLKRSSDQNLPRSAQAPDR